MENRISDNHNISQKLRKLCISKMDSSKSNKMLKLWVLIAVVSFALPLSKSEYTLDGSISWPLPNGLPLASAITIKGKTWGDTLAWKEFIIDLKESVTCATGLSKADTMLHMSMRYGERYIVFNNYLDGRYIEEQRHYDVPVKKNSEFKIEISVLGDRFKVAVSDKEEFYFNYRLPYSRIKHIAVYGAVYVSEISIADNSAKYHEVPTNSSFFKV